MPYYIAPYVGRGTRADPFRPVGSDQAGWSAIDLRPDGGATPDGNGLNACLLHLPSHDPDPALQQFAEDKQEQLLPAAQARLVTTLKLGTLTQTRFDTIVENLLVAPPSNGWRKLAPTAEGFFEIYLGGLFSKWKPGSVGAKIDDNFNRTTNLDGSTSSDGQFTWTEYTGTLWTVAATVASATFSAEDFVQARAEFDMTGNMYAQATLASYTRVSGDVVFEIATRLQPSGANPDYYAATTGFQSGVDQHLLYKNFSGANTTLATDATDHVVGEVLRCEANGSTIAYKKDGVHLSSSPVTDTSITSSVKRTGFNGYASTSGAIITIDDFVALDIGASTPDQWMPYGPRAYAFLRANRFGSLDTMSPAWFISTGGASTPDKWMLYGPTQYRARAPARDYNADVRISGFEATSPSQWTPYGPTQIPDRTPKRDYIADVRISGFEATSPTQWTPYGPTQYRNRAAQRDMIADVRISGFEATRLDQWAPHGPTPYQLRMAKRDLTADVRISGFEAITIDQWGLSLGRQYQLVFPQRATASELLQLVSVLAPTPDQWTPYGPTQYRTRPAQRDMIADVRLSGFEATSIALWHPSLGRQYQLVFPQRGASSGLPVQSLVGWFLASSDSVSGDIIAPLAMVGGTMVNMASPATSTSGFSLSTSRSLGLGEFRLDGIDDYIQVTQGGYFIWHALPFTLALWVFDDTNIGAGFSHRFMSWYDGTNNIQLGLTTDIAATSTKRIIYVVNAAATAQPQAISAGDLTTGWHHVAATYDGFSSYKVYVDGSLSVGDPATVGTNIGVQLTDTTNLFLGQRGDSAGWTLGKMDDMRLYSRELSAAEIYQLSTVSAATLDQWAPYGPTQYQTRPAQRDYSADVRISGFEATPLALWHPSLGRQYQLVFPRRAASSELIQLFTVSATPPDQWMPYGPIQYRLRPTQRDFTADVRLSGFEATPIALWHPALGRQYQILFPQRAVTSELLQFLTGGATTPDQWAPYGPTQYRMRAAQRDYLATVRLSGFEATTIDQWGVAFRQQYAVVFPLHTLSSELLQLVVAAGATTPDQWMPYGPTAYGLRTANRFGSFETMDIAWFIPAGPAPPQVSRHQLVFMGVGR